MNIWSYNLYTNIYCIYIYILLIYDMYIYIYTYIILQHDREARFSEKPVVGYFLLDPYPRRQALNLFTPIAIAGLQADAVSRNTCNMAVVN